MYICRFQAYKYNNASTPQCVLKLKNLVVLKEKQA